MSFIEKLRRLCDDKNKSKVSRKAGLPPVAISNYLFKGQTPSADRAFRIAKALDVSVEWMLDDSKNWPPVWKRAGEPAHAA